MAIPSNKSSELEQFLEKNFGRTTAILTNKCVFCKGAAEHFADEISKTEYSISGLCQKCQDEIYGQKL